MKAAILVEQRKPLVVADIEVPETLQYGQVLVKIAYSGICGSQIGEIDGVKGHDPYLPHLLGHEAGGIVEKCGPGVSKVKAGDHVVLHWRKGDGIEAPTAKYKWGNQTVNSGWVTTFSEYSIVSENRITLIPSDFDLKLATLYGCALTTAFGSVINDAELKIGESVLVLGIGGVGLPTILAAKMVSAYPIVAVDIFEHKLNRAAEYGATHLINSANSNIEEEIKNIIPGGVDVVIETTGVKEIIELASQLTSRSGRTILVGVPKTPNEKMSIESLPLHFEKRITGSHGGDINPSYHIPRFIRLQQKGHFDLTGMITHTFGLSDINTAIDMMRRGDVLRCVIDMAAN